MSKWDAYGLRKAREEAKESKDPSTKVGACILRPDGTPASTGWNGFARRVRETPERLADRAVKIALTIHAEKNAILNAREPLHAYTLYVWPLPPCAQCASAIIQAGITRVVHPFVEVPERWRDDMNLAAEALCEAGVVCHAIRCEEVPA